MVAGQGSQAGRFRWRRWAVAGAVVAVAASGALSPVRAEAVVGSADLSVAVSHTPDTPVAPSDVKFTVTASNAGPSTASGVVVALGFDYPLEPRTVPSGCRITASYRSLICDLGNLASGSSKSAVIILQAHASGLYTVPAAVGSDTPDPDTADRSANDTVLIKAGPSQAERYIRGIFPIILDRPATNADVAYWGPRWKAENFRYPRHLEKIPGGIINSNEYRRIRVREAYPRILGRSADSGAVAHWVTELSKGMSYETFERRLITSSEFTRKAGTVQGMIKNTYLAVQGRQPTAAEASAAFDSQGRQSFAAFVLSVQRSTGGYDAVIKRVYQDTFGTAPSSLARYLWQLELRAGKSPEALWAKLLVSNEVLRLYPYTEDDYIGSGEPVFDFRTSTNAAAAAASAS